MTEPDIFDEWLATGTLRRLSVTLYADQAAADELDAIAAEFEEANKAAKRRTLDEKNPMADLKARWDAAHERWEASRATFTVVRLEEPIREQLAAEFAEPPAPRSPGTGATEKRKEQWGRDVEAWKAEAMQITADREHAALAYAIESVETGAGKAERTLTPEGRVEKPAVGPERLRAMFSKPYGPQWHLALVGLLNEVSAMRGEPERPFSLGPSGSDQD